MEFAAKENIFLGWPQDGFSNEEMKQFMTIYWFGWSLLLDYAKSSHLPVHL